MIKTSAQEAYYKFAQITPEDVSAGLAGYKNRPITSQEVVDYAEAAKQKALRDKANSPLVGGLLTGLGGVAAGAGIGYGLSGGRLGAAILGAGAGGIGGAGLGALLGSAAQSAYGQGAKRNALYFGDVAQQGRMPFEVPRNITRNDLLSRAIGTQEKQKQTMGMDDYAALRKELRNAAVMRNVIEGATTGGAAHGLAAMDNRREGESVGSPLEAAAAGAALHGGLGALHGAGEARRDVKALADLYERGYGHLADRLKLQATRGAFE